MDVDPNPNPDPTGAASESVMVTEEGPKIESAFIETPEQFTFENIAENSVLPIAEVAVVSTPESSSVLVPEIPASNSLEVTKEEEIKTEVKIEEKINGEVSRTDFKSVDSEKVKSEPVQVDTPTKTPSTHHNGQKSVSFGSSPSSHSKDRERDRHHRDRDRKYHHKSSSSRKRASIGIQCRRDKNLEKTVGFSSAESRPEAAVSGANGPSFSAGPSFLTAAPGSACSSWAGPTGSSR